MRGLKRFLSVFSLHSGNSKHHSASPHPFCLPLRLRQNTFPRGGRLSLGQLLICGKTPPGRNHRLLPRFLKTIHRMVFTVLRTAASRPEGEGFHEDNATYLLLSLYLTVIVKLVLTQRGICHQLHLVPLRGRDALSEQSSGLFVAKAASDL